MALKGTAIEQPKQIFKIEGLSLPIFTIVSVVILLASYMGKLPKGMVGAFPIMIVIGAILNEIGNRTPIIKDYFGGGPIVVIFGSAALVTYNILPAETAKTVIGFMKNDGAFLNFYIAALITGSILGMDRKLLIKASLRYLPAIIGGVTLALLFVGTAGGIMGYGVKKAIFYIGLPIMGGGMGAGAVPLANIFGEALKTEPKEMLSVMVPALALGNALSIVVAGILNRMGKSKPSITGNGKLMRGQDSEIKSEEILDKIEYKNLGIGLLLSTTFFIFGGILAKYIPLHSYALMIMSVAAVKILGLLPKEYEKGAFQWFRFIMTNLTPALLVGIGLAYTDLNAVISSLTPTYIILVLLTVLGAAIGSGVVGHFMKFYFVESAITAGLCMANMGGTGDVAVLSSADRMELMPFAQISSRIGGAFMLILATVILGILT